MNLKMPSLISNDLRILRFVGAMRVFVRGNLIFLFLAPGDWHGVVKDFSHERREFGENVVPTQF
jgi:hypothetical protein